jgi:hypothetical protein
VIRNVTSQELSFRVKSWRLFDQMAMMQQLGVIPHWVKVEVTHSAGVAGLVAKRKYAMGQLVISVLINRSHQEVFDFLSYPANLSNHTQIL